MSPNTADAKPYCQANPRAILSLVDNCAAYINCTAYTSGEVSDPVQECPYPQLFDDTTGRCEQFDTVACGNRAEPQAPCKHCFVKSDHTQLTKRMFHRCSIHWPENSKVFLWLVGNYLLGKNWIVLVLKWMNMFMVVGCHYVN